MIEFVTHVFETKGYLAKNNNSHSWRKLSTLWFFDNFYDCFVLLFCLLCDSATLGLQVADPV